MGARHKNWTQGHVTGDDVPKISNSDVPDFRFYLSRNEMVKYASERRLVSKLQYCNLHFRMNVEISLYQLTPLSSGYTYCSHKVHRFH